MSRMIFRLALITLLTIAQALAAKTPFDIDDYFKLKHIMELSLSSDGEMIVYAVEAASLAENKGIRTVFVGATRPGIIPKRIDKIQNARGLEWIPGTHELAYLANVDGATQIFSIDPKTTKTQQITSENAPVTAFHFAPDGSALAWISQTRNSKSTTLYDRLFEGDTGIVVDSENTAGYQFVNPEWPDVAARPSNELWLRPTSGGKARRVDIPGKVKSFYWSSDAKQLSISYVDDDIPFTPLSERYTSIGTLNVATGAFRPIARARAPSQNEGALYYSGGEWIPETNKLIIRRTKQDDPWSSTTGWSFYDLSQDNVAFSSATAWRPIEIYRADREPAFRPVNEGLIYSEKTIRAHKSLYVITPAGIRQASFLKDITGATSQVRFSDDFETAAFVNEDLDRPPEIYIWRKGHRATLFTRLNNVIAAKQLPQVKEVYWRSKDGISVQGWLLEPIDASKKPWPLVTFVHGGPTFVFSNQFAKYFHLWPYPLEVHALNGIAVFIPNYRGTESFGYDFQHPSAIDKEPVNDIITGIDQLVANGIADPKRLAISGHSHGAWLAPITMTKANYFRSASFAEGGLNKIVSYNLLPNWLNRNVHDIQYGESLYDNPGRYIELSPDLHMKGLDTAVLFEAGAKSLAIGMMGAPKAARRAGLPAEFVVYPKTVHNIAAPRLQIESARRNLDWFRFWLQNYEDPAPNKQVQYERWRKMRRTP